MEKYKIKQILTTTQLKLNAVFLRKGASSAYEIGMPLLGMALIEDEEGRNEIKILIANEKGLVQYLEDGMKDFVELRPMSKGLREYSVYNLL